MTITSALATTAANTTPDSTPSATSTVKTIIKSIINRHNTSKQLMKPGNVRCFGVNGCRGLGTCKSKSNSCKGQNDCSGKGFIVESAIDCENAAGTTALPKEEELSLINSPSP